MSSANSCTEQQSCLYLSEFRNSRVTTSSYETEQKDVTLPVTTSKFILEILPLSY